MTKTCGGSSIPVVRLALEKDRCLRRGAVALRTPKEIAEYVFEHYGCRAQELFLSLAFNSRNELLSIHEVSLGGISTTAVDPRVVFSGAVLSGADAIVVVHNHPSGNPEPSSADVQVTRQLVQGAAILSIRLLDHIIIARGVPMQYTSFVERGVMPRSSELGGFGDEEIEYGGITPVTPVRRRRR